MGNKLYWSKLYCYNTEEQTIRMQEYGKQITGIQGSKILEYRNTGEQTTGIQGSKLLEYRNTEEQTIRIQEYNY